MRTYRICILLLLSSPSISRKCYSGNVTPGKVRLTTRVPLLVAFPLRGKFSSVLMYEIRLQLVPGGKLFEFVCTCVTLPVTFEYLRHGQQALLCVTGICRAILKVILIWEGALAIVKTFPSIEVGELHYSRVPPLSQLV
jgi:hypothetical protein